MVSVSHIRNELEKDIAPERSVKLVKNKVKPVDVNKIHRYHTPPKKVSSLGRNKNVASLLLIKFKLSLKICTLVTVVTAFIVSHQENTSINYTPFLSTIRKKFTYKPCIILLIIFDRIGKLHYTLDFIISEFHWHTVTDFIYSVIILGI